MSFSEPHGPTGQPWCQYHQHANRLQLTLWDHGYGAITQYGYACLLHRFCRHLLCLPWWGWPGWVNLGWLIKYQHDANMTWTHKQSPIPVLTGPNVDWDQHAATMPSNINEITHSLSVLQEHATVIINTANVFQTFIEIDDRWWYILTPILNIIIIINHHFRDTTINGNCHKGARSDNPNWEENRHICRCFPKQSRDRDGRQRWAYRVFQEAGLKEQKAVSRILLDCLSRLCFNPQDIYRLHHSVCNNLVNSEADGLHWKLKQWVDKFTDDLNFLDEFSTATATDYCMT